MSRGPSCRVPTSRDIPTPSGYHRHVVIARNRNNSAFNGYHDTWSQYSGILCLETFRVWRSKGAYVNDLPDITRIQEFIWTTGTKEIPE